MAWDMDSTSPRQRPRSKSSSSRPCARASLWTIRLAFALNFVWPTEGRSKMRKFVFAFLFLAAGSAAALAPAASARALPDDAPQAVAEKARTKEEGVNREGRQTNHMYGRINE